MEVSLRGAARHVWSPCMWGTTKKIMGAAIYDTHQRVLGLNIYQTHQLGESRDPWASADTTSGDSLHSAASFETTIRPQ